MLGTPQDASNAYTAALRSSLQLDSALAPPLTSPARPGSADRDLTLARSASLGCAAAPPRETTRLPGLTGRLSARRRLPPRGAPAASARSPATDAVGARRRRRSPGAKKLFRFYSDGASAGAAAESPFELSPFGADLDLGALRKPARKIARSPFKARAPVDAPQPRRARADKSNSPGLAV